MKKFPHPFAYYALRYLLQWEQTERHMHEQFARFPTERVIRDALHHFRLARSFKGCGESETQKLILDAVACVGVDAIPEDAVPALASAFKQSKFDKYNLSAASKLLWCKYRAPYLIYDSQAVSALKQLGQRFDTRSYPDFFKAWRLEYDKYSREIDDASKSLASAAAFVKHWHPNSQSLSQLASQPWFKERIFDIGLWEMGRDG